MHCSPLLIPPTLLSVVQLTKKRELKPKLSGRHFGLYKITMQASSQNRLHSEGILICPKHSPGRSTCFLPLHCKKISVYLRILFLEIIRILYGTSSVDMSVRRLTETNPFPYINGNQPDFRTHQRKEIAIECKYMGKQTLFRQTLFRQTLFRQSAFRTTHL